MTYLDTSFLMKVYFPEKESEEVNAFLQPKPTVVITTLTDVEMHAAAYRKAGCVEAERILEIYNQDRSQGVYRELAMPVNIHLLAQQLAKELCDVVRLRSLDLLHLAAAIDGRIDAFATFDSDLGRAANASGLSVIGARP